MEINEKIPIVICIILIIFCLSGIPFKFAKNIISPVKENITVNVTPQIIYVNQTITVLVTPTIDGKTYFASEYQEGIRKIKRPFSFIRPDVSGRKDLVTHVVIYDYKVFNSYTWFNPSDYKYYKQYPTEGYKFVFVFINIYMDNIMGDDPRMWCPDERHYGLQANDILYMPIEFEKQLRIKELEETYNYNDDSRVGYYATFKYTSSNLEHAKTAGETYNNLTYLRGGKSNAIDGYLVYEVPINTKDEDLILSGNFYTFGDAAWKLKP